MNSVGPAPYCASWQVVIVCMSVEIRSIYHMLEFFDSIGPPSPGTGAVP